MNEKKRPTPPAALKAAWVLPWIFAMQVGQVCNITNINKLTRRAYKYFRGLYIEKYHPRGGGYQTLSFPGKINEKGKEKKGENVKEKGIKGKEGVYLSVKKPHSPTSKMIFFPLAAIWQNLLLTHSFWLPTPFAFILPF